MTIDEMKITTVKFRNEARRQLDAAKDKMLDARATDNETAEDSALEELFYWRRAELDFDSALGALISLEHLHDKFFGMSFERRQSK